MTRRRPVKPHQHGTITGYTSGCHCTPCKAANTRSTSQNRRRRAMGITSPHDLLPSQHSRLVLTHLRDLGYLDPQLAQLTGVSIETITHVRKDNRRYVTRETADRIDEAWALLDRIPPQDRLAARYVDSCGARHRIRALMTQGWSLAELGRRLGHSAGYLSPALYDNRQITPRLHQSISRLYDELWNQTGTSLSTAKRAAARGWPTPLELDEDLIEDPTYEPRLHRQESAQEKGRARDERRQEVARLTALGLSGREIAMRLDIDQRQVVRDRGVIREAS